MSVSKWAYTPEVCDGEGCPGDCDLCDKPKNMEDEDDEEYPVEECKNCRRFNKAEMKQRNHLYCLLKCDPYGRACLSAAFAYNEAMFGDPNIYGIDGTVLTPNGVKKRGECDD